MPYTYECVLCRTLQAPEAAWHGLAIPNGACAGCGRNPVILRFKPKNETFRLATHGPNGAFHAHGYAAFEGGAVHLIERHVNITMAAMRARLIATLQYSERRSTEVTNTQINSLAAVKERFDKAKPKDMDRATGNLRRVSTDLFQALLEKRGHLVSIDRRLQRRAERDQFGGMIPMAASKWTSTVEMTRILNAALAQNAALIHQQLQPLTTGQQCSFTFLMAMVGAGIGLKLVQGHLGPVIKPTTRFTRLQMTLLVTDHRNKEFVVLTAYPDA